MAPDSASEPLNPDVAARLQEFARACKAATRIVSLYPPSHPSIQGALARIVAAGTTATLNGPFVITVMPRTLRVDGRGLPKSDTSVDELADLLHQQLVGELALDGPLDGGAWHAFLSLLAKPPEEVRALGGIARAWDAAGGGPIRLREIDYAELLRERAGARLDSDWNSIIANCLQGDDRGGLDEATLAALLEISGDPDQLAEFAERLLEHARANGADHDKQKRSLLQLMHGLANYAARAAPDRLPSVVTNMAKAAMKLAPELMVALMTSPPPASQRLSVEEPMDLGSALQAHLTDEMLASYVAATVMQDRGATQRLAQALHALAPEDARRMEIMTLADTAAGQSPFGRDPQFGTIWSTARDLLLSYSDERHVSADYADELTGLRGRAVEIEDASDDPPERVAAWLATVSDQDIRTMDQQILLDLLAIEDRPDAWAAVLEMVLARVEQLVLVADLRLAAQLVTATAKAAEPGAQFADDAADGLRRLASGPAVKHIVTAAGQVPDADAGLVTDICMALGPSIVPALTDALVAEENTRGVRRLRDVLIAFGAAARAHVERLRRSENPAVRRIAVDLLRALAGPEALSELRSLLEDPDAQVQREALRAILHIGTREALDAIQSGIASGDARTREAILQGLATLRDERAVPLLLYVLKHVRYTGALESTYLSTVEALGKVATDGEAVDVLRDVLYRGQWWAPGRTKRLRGAAASALWSVGTTRADGVLRDAAARGPRGVRTAAESAMTRPRGKSPERKA
jgi:DNA-directed RNA polymerase subunit F